jgi:hypothetical protein
MYTSYKNMYPKNVAIYMNIIRNHFAQILIEKPKACAVRVYSVVESFTRICHRKCICVRFVVFTAVTMDNAVFLVVT